VVGEPSRWVFIYLQTQVPSAVYVGDDFNRGLLIGLGSVNALRSAIRKSLGEWALPLPYLQYFRARAELELVAAIGYILGRDVELTPTLKVAIAEALVESEKRLLITSYDLLQPELLKGGAVGEEREE